MVWTEQTAVDSVVNDHRVIFISTDKCVIVDIVLCTLNSGVAMTARFYEDGSVTIQQVDGGYMLVIAGNTRQTTLLIRHNGGVIDASGAPVDSTDMMTVRTYLSCVGGADLVPLLHYSNVTPEAAAAIIRRMVPRN